MDTKYVCVLKFKRTAFAGFHFIKKFMIPSRFCFRAAPAAFLVIACLLALAGPFPAGAQGDAGADKIYEPANTRVRLALPENWRPAQAWAENPAAGEQAGGLLFAGEAFAPTGEAVTGFNVNRLPAIKIPSEVFPLMTQAEQNEFCQSLLKSFAESFTRETGVAPVGAKAMIKRLGGWYTIMLTARFISGDTDIIINQVAYSLPDKMLSLTFYTQAPLIAVMAPDMAYILESFNPDTRLAPREALPRENGETLDAYLARIKP